MKDKQLSSIIEEKRTKEGDYPSYWPLMSKQVKALAKWQCERCGAPNNEDSPDGKMLTVHHLDGNKMNCEWWNLAALCQRCHLRIQKKLVFFQVPEVYDWETNTYSAITTHSLWMARHIKSFNVFAWLTDIKPIPLENITERSYEKEWQE